MSRMSTISAAMTLFLVMDSIGNVPMFSALLRKVPTPRRTWVIVRENLIALVTLIFFLFFGQAVMTWLRISATSLATAGGIVLFIVALDMIFPRRGLVGDHDENTEPLIVPLAIPLLAGPSTVAMIMLLATQEPSRWGDWLLALLAAWFVGLIILLLASKLQDWLGHRALLAIERLMGMILVVVAVQMTMDGIHQFLTLTRLTTLPG